MPPIPPQGTAPMRLMILAFILSLCAGYGVMHVADGALARVDTVCQEGC